MPSVIETKEIGISFSIGQGSFVNTEIINGSLRLKKIAESASLEPIYEKEGHWISKVIDTVDKFKKYDKIAVAKTQFTKDLYKIETRTSDNGIDFNAYIALSAGGSILSPKNRYVQIKITLYAGFLDESFIVSDFNSPTDVNKWEDSSYIETNGVLKLKRNYKLLMVEDTSWTGTGTLLKKSIAASKIKRIDKLGVE